MLLTSTKVVVEVVEEAAEVVVVEAAAMEDPAEVALDVQLVRERMVQPQEHSRQASSAWSYQY